MSVTDPSLTNRTNTAPATGARRYDPRYRADETKASFKTTELWAAIIGVVALIVVYNVADDPSLSLWRTCLLATVLGAAYIISRGLAKSGSRPEDYRNRDYVDR
jgi:hypothetical protein